MQAVSDGPAGRGSVGWARENGLGVLGFSGNVGIPAHPRKTGVLGRAGQDATSVGVSGSSSTGRGGVFKGKAAQLRLTRVRQRNTPTSGKAGDCTWTRAASCGSARAAPTGSSWPSTRAEGTSSAA